LKDKKKKENNTSLLDIDLVNSEEDNVKSLDGE